MTSMRTSAPITTSGIDLRRPLRASHGGRPLRLRLRRQLPHQVRHHSESEVRSRHHPGEGQRRRGQLRRDAAVQGQRGHRLEPGRLRRGLSGRYVTSFNECSNPFDHHRPGRDPQRYPGQPGSANHRGTEPEPAAGGVVLSARRARGVHAGEHWGKTSLFFGIQCAAAPPSGPRETLLGSLACGAGRQVARTRLIRPLPFPRMSCQ